jgi:hypothetical protein
MRDQPGQLEVVDAPEEAKWRLPADLGPDDVGHDGLVRQGARQRRIELRAPLLEVVRHPAENLGDGLRQGLSPA